jgi:flagellin-specific chaperone FliS
MDDDLPESVKKCLDILDENIEILADLEFNLDDEKEDDLTPNMELHNLYDMTEDVAQSAKIKRAESNLARRQAEDSL